MSQMFSCGVLLWVLLASFQTKCSTARLRGLGETAKIVLDENSSQKSNLISNKISITGESRHRKSSKVIKEHSDNKDKIEVREMVVKSDKTSTRNHLIRKRNYNNYDHQLVKFLSETGGGSGGGSAEVTYKVPKRKRGEKQPGFNLDYSPPKVHPPHHN